MVLHVTWSAYCIGASLMNVYCSNKVLNFHQEMVPITLVQVPTFIKVKTIIVYNFFVL